MKPYLYSFIFLFVFLISVRYPILHAQEINHSTWSVFVESNSNPAVVDTFMMQTFTQDPSNNWLYEDNNKIHLFNPKDEDINDCHDGAAIKILPGGTLRMVDFDRNNYSDVHIYAIYAAWKVIKGENLYLSTDREREPAKNVLWLGPSKSYSRSFRQNKPESKTGVGYIRLDKNPWNLKLDVTQPTGTNDNGFYAVDSVCAFGTTNLYSLFTGKGFWHEFARWTHNPALRHRHALINGKVSIDNYSTCNQIYIGNGYIDITADQYLKAQSINFCDNVSALYSSGELDIKESINVYKTFEEPGKWYFISFPFDVYTEGLDPAFQLGDKDTQANGNYFYLLTYNGEKRSSIKDSNENWEVVSSSLIGSAQPVFEKNKGYLIALDEGADNTTLCFSSSKGDIPSDFSRNGSVTIYTSTKDPAVDDADHGWYLCGNPLAAPLPLKSIESNPSLDGNIYVYEDNTYKQYSLDSDYSLSPFSAFFVKASGDTELTIRESTPLRSYNMISTSIPLSSIKAEPHLSYLPVPTTSTFLTKTQTSYVELNSLFLEHLLMPGVVYLMDLGGRIIWEKEVNAGSSVLSLPSSLSQGIYIIAIETSQYRAQHKFVLSH